MMDEKTYDTIWGTIHYWVSGQADNAEPQLVFLPGLTVDHRLFGKQIEYFEGKYPLLVWDAPGHGASWPFSLTFSLMDKALWLEEILQIEEFHAPVIVGQSMGGYLGQAYAQRFPGRSAGYISIDSAPLQRSYVTAFDLWLLKNTEPIYRRYPWETLMRDAVRGVAATRQGRNLMQEMLLTYDGDHDRYVRLAGHGFRILAEAIEMDLPYMIDCPALLICGRRDRAGQCRRLNRKWHKRTGIPIEWIDGAGHNANADRPEIVNGLIERWVRLIKLTGGWKKDPGAEIHDE